MELRQLEKWRENIKAMDWAIDNAPVRHTSVLIDNRFMLLTLFGEHGIKEAAAASKSAKNCSGEDAQTNKQSAQLECGHTCQKCCDHTYSDGHCIKCGHKLY